MQAILQTAAQQPRLNYTRVCSTFVLRRNLYGRVDTPKSEQTFTYHVEDVAPSVWSWLTACLCVHTSRCGQQRHRQRLWPAAGPALNIINVGSTLDTRHCSMT